MDYLINDIVAPLQGDLRRRVREAIMADFSDDMDTCEMTF